MAGKRTMRRGLILTIFAVFGAYLVFANRNQTYYRVPDYLEENVDIRGGVTPAQWDNPRYASMKHERLDVLEKRRLQLSSPVVLSKERTLRPEETLLAADYEALLNLGLDTLQLRDPTEVFRFVGRGLELRDGLTLEEKEKPGEAQSAGEEARVFAAGEPVTKEMVDRLLEAGVARVSVVGAGNVVGFNATLFLVILIFLGMALVLQEIFWEPFAALMDKRSREIQEGQKAARTGHRMADRIRNERRERRRAIHGEYIAGLRTARHKTLLEADRIMAKAMGEMKTLRETADLDLKRELQRTEAELRKEIPSLAKVVAETVMRMR
ncbi:MAG: ATP synthase F0 subunit B [Planctomycetota bacterium]